MNKCGVGNDFCFVDLDFCLEALVIVLHDLKQNVMLSSYFYRFNVTI